jgi:hypothetical protein
MSQDKNGVEVLIRASTSEIVKEVSKYEAFAQLANFIVKPLVLYRLSDHEIVFANGEGIKYLREIFTDNGSEQAGNIFVHAADLHVMEKNLLKSKSHVMRNVAISTKTSDIQRKNIVSRLHAIGKELHVFMIFWDANSK